MNALQEPEKPKPADLGFPRTFLGGVGLAVGSVVLAYVANVISDGKMSYEFRKGFVPVKTEQDRQADLARLRARQRVNSLTEAISKTTDPHEQAMLYLQRAQAYRELGQENQAHTDEGRAQQIQLRSPRSLNPR